MQLGLQNNCRQYCVIRDDDNCCLFFVTLKFKSSYSPSPSLQTISDGHPSTTLPLRLNLNKNRKYC